MLVIGVIAGDTCGSNVRTLSYQMASRERQRPE
ncbi:hypothetical protein K2D_15370 [Planctomycetes bacterium K2D]|uniref:Uncharacterized protein n=1 Tax=Botrimarina mediterranea TaxID=2528022 RepID=A0A518K6K0_9BACT|nr:hypothetical protein Spa11_16110 [Botrimarina mediterranea]QDV77932.1 hypothetical protein K2D_15370 [Planctomycetes bacterium K2D]